MNWTGGSLSRHSGTASSTRNRQEQHYAKAQQSLRNGTNTKSPVKWSIFNQIVEEGTGNHWKSKTPQADFETGFSRERSQSIQLRYASPTNDRLPTRKGRTSRSPQPVDAQNSRHSQIHIKRERSPTTEDDLYNATPPQRNTKRKSGDSVQKYEGEDFRQQQEATALERRRRLLRKGDWIGVGALRPAQVSFAAPRRDENVGKRRRVTDGHRPRFESRQAHVTSPFTRRNRSNLTHDPGGHTQGSQAVRPDVRISIGGRVVPPGVSSSTRRSRASGRSSRVTPSRPYQGSLSSDVMLLDEYLSSPRLGNIRVNNTSGVHNVVHVVSSNSTRRSVSASFLEQQNSYRSSEIQDGARGWETGPWDSNKDTSFFPERPRGRSGENPNASHHSNRSQPALSPISAIKGRAQKGELVVSSSASIQHPAPQSSKVSLLLRSGSSEIAESTAAQIGKMKRIVPSSQILDNEIWRTWMAPLYDKDGYHGNGHDYEENNSEVAETSISPGISAAPIARHCRRGHLDDTDGLEVEIPVPTGIEDANRERFEDTTSVSGYWELEESALISENYGSRGREEPLAMPAKSRKSKFLATAQGINAAPEIKIALEQLKEGPDEIWRRFVFGSDEGDIQPTSSFLSPSTSVHNERDESMCSSMLAHPPTNNSSNPPTQNRLDIVHRSSTDRLSSVSATTSADEDGSSFLEPGYKKSHVMAMPMDCNPGTYYGSSIRAFKGTIAASSSDSTLASIAGGTNPRSSKSLSEATTPLHITKRKVLFTNTNQIVGQKSSSSDSFREEPLHAGRGLVDDRKEDPALRRMRARKKYLYSILGSDEGGDLESSEDG